MLGPLPGERTTVLLEQRWCGLCRSCEHEVRLCSQACCCQGLYLCLRFVLGQRRSSGIGVGPNDRGIHHVTQMIHRLSWQAIDYLSDHGTNFDGAARELKEFAKFIEKRKTQSIVSEFKCTKFIPERAPHFGGLWEAAVKSSSWERRTRSRRHDQDAAALVYTRGPLRNSLCSNLEIEHLCTYHGII
jgi:hypothetical protein